MQINCQMESKISNMATMFIIVQGAECAVQQGSDCGIYRDTDIAKDQNNWHPSQGLVTSCIIIVWTDLQADLRIVHFFNVRMCVCGNVVR